MTEGIARPVPVAQTPGPLKVRPKAKPSAALVVSSAPVGENVDPGGQFQVIGELLGFDIPPTKKEFLERFEETGGQCGASKNLSGMRALARSAVSDCWSGSQCPAPAEGLSCKTLRTAYDNSGRMVLFSATIHSDSSKPSDAKREMATVLHKFSELGLGEAKITSLKNGQMSSATGIQGQFRLAADVMSVEGQQQVGVFSVAAK